MYRSTTWPIWSTIDFGPEIRRSTVAATVVVAGVEAVVDVELAAVTVDGAVVNDGVVAFVVGFITFFCSRCPTR